MSNLIHILRSTQTQEARSEAADVRNESFEVGAATVSPTNYSGAGWILQGAADASNSRWTRFRQMVDRPPIHCPFSLIPYSSRHATRAHSVIVCGAALDMSPPSPFEESTHHDPVCCFFRHACPKHAQASRSSISLGQHEHWCRGHCPRTVGLLRFFPTYGVRGCAQPPSSLFSLSSLPSQNFRVQILVTHDTHSLPVA